MDDATLKYPVTAPDDFTVTLADGSRHSSCRVPKAQRGEMKSTNAIGAWAGATGGKSSVALTKLLASFRARRSPHSKFRCPAKGMLSVATTNYGTSQNWNHRRERPLPHGGPDRCS